MRTTFTFGVLAFFFSVLAFVTQAQQPAFPGAEGAGRYTSGGRGTVSIPTTVFEVTNLNDDNNPGSLRYAVQASASTYPYRTIVFRVAGTIHLNSRLTIRSNITIAGQTAPGGGICIADHPVVISGDNVIIRYLRIRMGDKNQNKGLIDGSGSDDVLSNLGNKNLIIDHCSISWSSDEALTVYRGDSVTMQWNIVSEPLNYSYHYESPGPDYQNHGYGGIWGGRKASFHHNLIAHAQGRSPRFAGSSTYPPGTPGQENADFRNNVIYNWGSYSTNGGEGGNYNVVNNYYKYGPSTNSGNNAGIPARSMIMNPSKSTDLPYPKVYMDGNYVDGYAAVTAANWKGVAMAGGSPADTVQSKVDVPFNIWNMPTHTALEAYELVLQGAGAALPQRDTLDQRIVNDVRNRTGRIIDVQGGFPHGTAYDLTVNAWPALAAGTPPVDTDHDGMPDTWELTNGLNPADAADRNGYSANGYTNLENYLNSLTTSSGSVPPVGTAAIVAWDGSGNYTSIQAAINAAPAGRTTPYIIYIKNGKYKEKIVIPANKPFIHLVGESVANTIITYDDGASTPLPGGGAVGTFNSYTLYVNANDFMAMHITIENSFGDGSQGVAVHVNGDRVAFKNCRFLGNQDTLLTNGNAGLKQYFRNCYIDGNVDFIFGSARAIFDSCIIYAKTRSVAGASYITAANTQPGQQYGYVFRNCILPANIGNTTYFLARPWQNSTGSSPLASNKTVFINSMYGDNLVRPEGWSTWDAGTVTGLIYFGEYKSKGFNGSLINTSQRVPWSYQLSDAEAATYTNANLFGAWDPCAVSAAFCTPFTPAIAVSNFRGAKVASTSVFNWNISWPIAQVTYELFRSSDRISFTKVHEQVSPNDTAINYNYSEAVPPAGQSYYYFIRASKTGMSPDYTDTIAISSTPAITVTGSPGNFIQALGAPSATQVYTVAAVNLTAGVVITPPPGYEISANGGTNWYTNSSPLTLAQSGGIVNTTNVLVRLNALLAGTYSGNITHTSSGALAQQVPVNGTMQYESLPVSNTLLYWPMRINAADSIDFRSAGVLASTPTLNKLFVSNGTTVPAVPAYSITYGQAFGATANGDGTWATGSGGPGGNLARTFYEQFTLTAKNGYTVKVDSLILSGSFYNTSSNTKMAVVYSLSGFTTADSTDITGGTGPGGSLVSTANGAYATPILLNNQTANTTDNYRLALAGATGVTVAAGQTLTIRLYFSCGSGSAGRYMKVKDVYIKGFAKDLSIPEPAFTATGSFTNFSQSLGVPSPVQTYSVSGNFLTGNLVVVPPAGFEVSANGGTNWYNSSSPLILAPVNGTVAATTISVRLNAATGGNYSGNIITVTSGAAAVNIPVTGAAVAASMQVTGTLANFSQSIGTPSATQSYTISARSVSTGITITPPVNYQVSANGGANWYSKASPLVLPKAGDSVATTTITVRLNASATGTYAGNIINTTTGATAINMAVNGATFNPPALNVNSALQSFSQTLSAPSPVQSFILTANYLNGQVTITPPAGYEVSVNGIDWFGPAAPLKLTAASGAAISQVIQVQLNAGATGEHNGQVVVSTAGAADVQVAVTGITHPELAIGPNPAHDWLTIYHARKFTRGTITLYNSNGIKLKTWRTVPATNTTTIDVRAWPAGFYYIEFTRFGQRTLLRFVKD